MIINAKIIDKDAPLQRLSRKQKKLQVNLGLLKDYWSP